MNVSKKAAPLSINLSTKKACYRSLAFMLSIRYSYLQNGERPASVIKDRSIGLAYPG
jgi:hypothetical protein